jgi:hypothetical protein
MTALVAVVGTPGRIMATPVGGAPPGAVTFAEWLASTAGGAGPTPLLGDG